MSVLNIAVSLTAVIVCTLSLLMINVGNVDKRTEWYGRLFYIFLILFALSNLVGLGFRGIPGAGPRCILYISNFCEFLAPDLLVLTISMYLLTIVDPEGKHKGLRRIQIFLAVLQTILLFISQFTGLFYIIDQANVYHRQPLYPLSYITTAIAVALNILILIKDRNKLTYREKAAFWIYFMVPLAAAVIQLFIYGVNIVILSTVIAGLIMYFYIITDQTERFYRQQQENADLKFRVLQSQIQPHFLFNSLATIRALCRIDPPEAERAVGLFSQYLRHNMSSIGSDKMIPFSRELEHTKVYLQLQEIRFGEDLTTEFDLACTEFLLPALTLQPLVENAVSHGVRKNPDGRGSVLVRTREYKDRFVIDVIDDGPGFDISVLNMEAGLDPSEENDWETHIGLKNVRNRLGQTGRGELVIDSAPGKGTKASIVMYKETKKGR